MSFRDLEATSRTNPVGGTPASRSRTLPSVRAMPLDEDERPRRSQTRLRRPIVLHGRVQRSSVDMEDDLSSCAMRSRRAESDQMMVRKEMERRSVYAQLLHETNQYQKTVSELEHVLPEAGEQPEQAWRAKILIKSAQAVDQDLWQKLYDYEKTLHSREEDPEVRQQQTACMKLHRDFKRAHKSLVMALTVYEKTQRAEIARLGAVGWSEQQDEQEDFYTRAMRERQEEIDRMNAQMHQVKDLYQDLGFLVQKQQEPIDELQEHTEEARTYTRSARSQKSLWEELMCFADQNTGMCQPQQTITHKNGRWQMDGEELVFAVPSCNNIAFESIQESIPEALLPHRKVAASESSIVSEYTEESPRGVIDNVSALSDDVHIMDYQLGRSKEDVLSNEGTLRTVTSNEGTFRTAEDTLSAEDTADYTHSRNLRVSQDFHWLMPFETIASDIQAVKNDIAYFGKEVLVQTNLMRSRSDSG